MTPHLGNSLTDGKGGIERMAALMTSAPALDPNKLDQIPALPLGGRVKLNAWDDHVELIKTSPVAITSARDKMPFEVTPIFPAAYPLRKRSQPGIADYGERGTEQLAVAVRSKPRLFDDMNPLSS